MIIPGQPRPLPVRPGPRPGETTATYIEHLARSNHLPADYLHRYLCTPPGRARRPDLSRLAAISGRTETALRHALADLSCAHCGSLLPTPMRARGRPARWCSPACGVQAFRQRTLQEARQKRRDRAGTPNANCHYCGEPFTRNTRGRPASWCSPACALRAHRQRAGRNREPGKDH